MIYIISLNFGREPEEREFVEGLLRFEGYAYEVVKREDSLFRRYYKGNGVVILDFIELDKEPVIIKGFWGLVSYMREGGCIRC